MRHATTIAIILMYVTCLNMPARAEIVYKCGESYSAQACPGGVTVHAADPRTKDQKEQADRSTARDIQTANALETGRLQQEARDLASNTPARQTLGISPKPDKKTVQRNTKTKPVRIKTAPVKKTSVPTKKTSPKKS
jgi:hypothetical protein